MKIRYYYNEPCVIIKAKYNPNYNMATFVSTIKKMSRYTICGVVNDEKTEIQFGYAICNPSDRFEKKIGRAIALSMVNINPFKTEKVIDSIAKTFINTARSIEEELNKHYNKWSTK